jgi:hypothetical protein
VFLPLGKRIEAKALFGILPKAKSSYKDVSGSRNQGYPER